MSQLRQIAFTLGFDEKARKICCLACQAPLADVGPGATHWKEVVPVSVLAASELPGWSTSVNKRLVRREFACPECSSLLDSEVALPEDPYLVDDIRL